jgi:hypothetical protein
MSDDYLLIIKIPIKGMDGPEARAKAHALLKEMHVPDGVEPVMKLQKLEPGKPPIGVAL